MRTEDIESDDDQPQGDQKDEEEKPVVKKEEEISKEYSVAEMLARRQLALQKKKFRIGVLCSGLLENPEVKVSD